MKYFSQQGGTGVDTDHNAGLNEFIAETYMLLTTYGHDYRPTSQRAQILAHNLPKTIALIASYLEKNQIHLDEVLK